VRRIDDLMRAYQGDVPGACVAVLHGGVPILRLAYGLADLEARVAATAATNFRLASLTKQFTAAAILLLAQDGRVGVADSVRQWLPGLPLAADGMLIRHLLTHTSGLIDYEDLIPEVTSSPLRDADVLHLLEAEHRGY
jgi:CubicO group peptidase (beta-lactamase class C family)